MSARSATRLSLLVSANGSNPAGSNWELGSRVIHFALWLATKCTAFRCCMLHWVYRSGVWSKCHKIHKQPFVAAPGCHSWHLGSRCRRARRGSGASRRWRAVCSFDCLWEAILHACNYTSLIDNAEKLHWFGVSRRSVASPPLITFQFCDVRFGFRRRVWSEDAADAITPERLAFLSTMFSERENH